MPTVVLDPGHQSSGADTGATGNGLREQDITLAICREIKPLLQYNGLTVVMTRDGDFVNGPYSSVNESLQTRVDIAENAKADLFLSVHIDAFDGTASGQTVLIAGTGGRAEQAANKVYAQINKVTGWPNRGVKVQNIMVLRETTMPAILTENGFITSPSDSVKLKDPKFIHNLAVAHAKGICDYFAITYKEQPQNVVVAPVVDKNAQAIALIEQALKLMKE
jgi:N-acetylmuramoyl-L-alanine amidase